MQPWFYYGIQWEQNQGNNSCISALILLALIFDLVVMTSCAVTLIFDVVVMMSCAVTLWHSYTHNKQAQKRLPITDLTDKLRHDSWR